MVRSIARVAKWLRWVVVTLLGLAGLFGLPKFLGQVADWLNDATALRFLLVALAVFVVLLDRFPSIRRWIGSPFAPDHRELKSACALLSSDIRTHMFTRRVNEPQRTNLPLDAPEELRHAVWQQDNAISSAYFHETVGLYQTNMHPRVVVLESRLRALGFTDPRLSQGRIGFIVTSFQIDEIATALEVLEDRVPSK
jgi:hypothetical protein